MLQSLWSNFFAFSGRVDRRRYVITAALLAPLKYLIDTGVAACFGQQWHLYNYIFPPKNLMAFGLLNADTKCYSILWAIAIPFLWIGISFTVRRLRDSGSHLGWSAFYFIPVANLVQFCVLAFAPTEEQIETESLPRAVVNVNPWFGLLGAVLLGLPLVLFSTHYLKQYSWSLFLGVPFVIGFFTSWFYNARFLHSRKSTIGMCCASPVLIALLLIGFRMEGAVCILMAAPLGIPISIAGGLLAYNFLQKPCPPFRKPSMTACIAVLPLMMLAEHAANIEPPTAPVITKIVVNAPVDVVWKNVVSFPPLAAPTELIFKSGIAYPIGATIDGSGTGAIRRCRFSTGDFVEPITIWDKDHLLAFNVTSEPPSMKEVGFGEIDPPHLRFNYMRSRHGQFRLVAIDANHTLLEGTTWYQDYFWPQVYWRPISDAIIHHIHMRVLQHVKQQAELQFAAENLRSH